jgi:hypothetical protein
VRLREADKDSERERETAHKREKKKRKRREGTDAIALFSPAPVQPHAAVMPPVDQGGDDGCHDEERESKRAKTGEDGWQAEVEEDKEEEAADADDGSDPPCSSSSSSSSDDNEDDEHLDDDLSYQIARLERRILRRQADVSALRLELARAEKSSDAAVGSSAATAALRLKTCRDWLAWAEAQALSAAEQVVDLRREVEVQRSLGWVQAELQVQELLEERERRRRAAERERERQEQERQQRERERRWAEHTAGVLFIVLERLRIKAAEKRALQRQLELRSELGDSAWAADGHGDDDGAGGAVTGDGWLRAMDLERWNRFNTGRPKRRQEPVGLTVARVCHAWRGAARRASFSRARLNAVPSYSAVAGLHSSCGEALRALHLQGRTMHARTASDLACALAKAARSGERSLEGGGGGEQDDANRWLRELSVLRVDSASELLVVLWCRTYVPCVAPIFPHLVTLHLDGVLWRAKVLEVVDVDEEEEAGWGGGGARAILLGDETSKDQTLGAVEREKKKHALQKASSPRCPSSRLPPPLSLIQRRQRAVQQGQVALSQPVHAPEQACQRTLDARPLGGFDEETAALERAV